MESGNIFKTHLVKGLFVLFCLLQLPHCQTSREFRNVYKWYNNRIVRGNWHVCTGNHFFWIFCFQVLGRALSAKAHTTKPKATVRLCNVGAVTTVNCLFAHHSIVLFFNVKIGLLCLVGPRVRKTENSLEKWRK